MKHDWLEECGDYCNGHEIFHIVQEHLTKENVTIALDKIMGAKRWVCDGELTETGAYFSTAKADIVALTKALSLFFPFAVCFGQDTWDNEGYIVCFENGSPSHNYHAQYEFFERCSDDPDYYEVELSVTSKNGYKFTAGGGMVHKDEIQSFEKFIRGGNDPAKKEPSKEGLKAEHSAKEAVYREIIVETLSKWIALNRTDDRYSDALSMCKQIIEIFSSDTEFYADDDIWEIIRGYVQEYETANDTNLM